MTIHQVYLSVGSNIDRDRNLSVCLDELDSSYNKLRVSSVYQSAPVGFDGDPFLNLVVHVEVSQTLPALIAQLKEIETDHGRDRANLRFSARTLDVDILLFDDLFGAHHGLVFPRQDISENAYVLRPLAELAADLVLPGGNKTIKDMWDEYERRKQPIQQVQFGWRGKQLPMLAT